MNHSPFKHPSRNFPLIEHQLRKYGRINRAHQLRALTYFADAESEPMPRMRWSLRWNEVKRYLEKAAGEIVG